ncbi:MAG: c-type cytochrome, partial [Planctomycetota bacterium]|nr:c-type cytochrome [Planctomycetota bacterium]
ALALFDGELRGRDRENGEKMFAAGRCVLCHRFAGRGGHSGPDLGSVGQRFSVRDILTAICEPSQTIAEQFQASIITRKDGSQIVGRIIIDDGEEVAVATNPFDFSQLTRIPAADVQNVELSPVSLMPPAMIAGMNAEEVRDLVAYLVSGGDKKHRVFARD